MNDRPSKPGFEVSGEPAELSGIVGERSAIRRHEGGPSAAEAFSASVDAIRNRTHGDTGTLSLRTILSAQLAQSRFIQQFPEAARPQWIDIITELMVTAKACVANGSTSSGAVTSVDFYQKYRKLREDEETRQTSEKLLFVERLADALSGTTFAVMEGNIATQWAIILCTSDELARSGAPSVLARGPSGETQKFQLLHVMGGLRAD